MKIVVCVNHVPDTETKIKVGPDNKAIDRAGVNFMLNPYDEFAVEEALRIKEKHTGEVTVMSLGPDVHKETLRKALAMGVEKAILLKDETARDSFGIAKALAEEIKTIAPDIVFFGKQSIDFDDAQVGTMVAEILGFASVSVVVKLTIENRKVTCEREIEGGHETVEAKLPCVIQAQRGLNEPRYPSLKGIMSAKTKPIMEKSAAPAQVRVEPVALRKPQSKATGKIVGTDKTAVAELVRLLHEEAKVI